MGVVYEAEDLKLGRHPCAQLPDDLPNDAPHAEGLPQHQSFAASHSWVSPVLIASNRKPPTRVRAMKKFSPSGKTPTPDIPIYKQA